MKFNLIGNAVSMADDALDLPDPVEHIFGDGDELEEAHKKIQEDGESMLRRMGSLEPTDPGLQKLETLIEDEFPGIQSDSLRQIVEQAHQEYEEAKKALGDIDSIGSTASFIALMSTAAALAPEGVTTPIALGLAAKGGKDAYDMIDRVNQANDKIEKVVELSDKIGHAREEFDRLWTQIQDEDYQREAAPEETAEQ